MLYIGIDVAKRKHDCFITNADGEVLEEVFTIENSKEGFEDLLRRIKSHQRRPAQENTKVGLEATGHYSDNIVGYLRKFGLPPVILNPLRVNLYRKGQSLRKTKTDKSDAKFIARMLIAEDLAPHSPASYHSEELKSLTRHRHRMIKAQSALKVSYDRLLTIIFPELETFVSNTLGVTELHLLLELSSAEAIASCHLTRLVNLVAAHSHGRHDRNWAIRLRELAHNSIGSSSEAKTFELRQIIRQLLSIAEEIKLLDAEIKKHVDKSGTTIMTIPGISYKLAAIILAEIGDIARFDNPGKLQAFAGLDPTTYQSGQFTGNKDVMVKRGSTYLRWALLMAARTACKYDKTFGEYLDRKLAQGKHYNCAMGHVAKKLIRVIFCLMTTKQEYRAQA